MCSIGWIRALFLFLPGNGRAKTGVFGIDFLQTAREDRTISLNCRAQRTAQGAGNTGKDVLERVRANGFVGTLHRGSGVRLPFGFAVFGHQGEVPPGGGRGADPPGGLQPGRVERRPGLPGRRGPRPFHRGGEAAAFAGAYPPAVSEMTILRQRHTRPGAAARRGNRKKGSSAL